MNNETQIPLSAVIFTAALAAVAGVLIVNSLNTQNQTTDKGILDADKRRKMRESWVLVEKLGLENVGVLMFKKIFTQAPEALQLFSFKDEKDLYNSPHFKKHAKSVVQAVGAAVDELDDASSLVRQLKRLGRSHANLGLKPAHYDIVGKCFLETMTGILDFPLKV